MAGYEPNRPTIGERIKESIPGTTEYQATHGVTGTHANVQGMKSHVPVAGTEEHRMREAGVVGGGMHHHSTVGAPTMGEKVKQSIPGTREYEVTHGMTDAHRTVQQAKAHIPGTEEHRIRESMQPGTGLGGVGATGGTYAGTTGTHYGTTGVGSSITHPHTTHTVGATGVGTTGTGYTETGQETMGHKVKKMIPGTREHEEKKIEQGRI